MAMLKCRMSQCPLCHSSIKDDFGLIECESCGAPLLVHVDGRVEHSGGKLIDQRTQSQINISVPDEVPASEPYREFSLNELPVEEPSVDAASSSMPEPSYENPIEPDFLSAEEVAEPPVENAEMYKPPVANDSPDLSDIERFANSDLAGGRDGVLRYTLEVSGIDTADVRESFREAITDKKFIWDTEVILRSIRNGKVRIEGVTPAKAFILISRLRDMPVKVTWEQYAIHQV